jgi:hypothetical protein
MTKQIKQGWVIIIFMVMLASSCDPEDKVSTAIDWNSYLSQHDLIWTQLATKWEEGKIIAAKISSEKGGSCKVRFKDRISSLTLKPGEEKSLTGL